MSPEETIVARYVLGAPGVPFKRPGTRWRRLPDFGEGGYKEGLPTTFRRLGGTHERVDPPAVRHLTGATQVLHDGLAAIVLAILCDFRTI